MGNIPLPALGIQPPQYQDPLKQYAEAVSLRAMQQQMQQQRALAPGQQQLQQQQLVGSQQENQQRDLALKSQQAQLTAAQDPSIGWDKPGAYDRYLVAARNAGALPADLLKLQTGIQDLKSKIATTDKTDLENQVTQNDTRRGKLLSVIQSKDPVMKQSKWEQEVTNEENQGTIPPGQVPHQYPGDGAATAIANHFAQGSVLAKEAISQQDADARLASALKPTRDMLAAEASDSSSSPEKRAAAQRALDKLNEMDVTKAAQTAQARIGAETSPDAVAAQAKLAGAKAQAEVPAHISAAIGTQQATGALLQGPALDQSAERYWETGQLPAGARSAGMMADIMKRAGELHPNGSIAANSAAYSANKGSLDTITKTMDKVDAFSSASNANIQQFKSLLPKLVDSKVPWINAPLRLLNKNLVGNEWAPAVDAARAVANREIARVTTDPNLTGALSDTARREVQDFNPSNATIPQVGHILDVLQQDMRNVHEGLSMQKQDIMGRIGAQSRSQQPPGANTGQSGKPPAGATHIANGSDGKKHYTNDKGQDLGIVGQ